MTVGQTVDQRQQVIVDQLNNARYASLTSRAVSDEAKQLIDSLIEFLEGREEYKQVRKNKRSAKARVAVRRTMEGFVGDLLRAQQDQGSGGWVYRSMKANSFSGEAVSYRTFLAVLDSLVNKIERKEGYQERSGPFDPGGPTLPIRGKASRFRATPMLLNWCSHSGIKIDEINRHFIEDLPQHPLVKKASSTRAPWGTKVRGRTLKFERTGKARLLEEQVRDLNSFLDTFDLRGGEHRGYVRIFNQGDREDFDWNKGGRLYSQGDNSCQRLKQEDRRRMTINGEKVCEIDIRASYLTIFHAHYGAPLDLECDPYDLPGLGAAARNVVKLWFVATFGNDGHLERWPNEIAREHREKHGRPLGKQYPVKRIREIALQHYPLLENWGSDGFGWADLMFIEREAMLGAMLKLMGDGIPSLSIHDSLIIPVSKREIAEAVLEKHYQQQTGACPVLKVHDPLPSEEAIRDQQDDDPSGLGNGEEDNESVQGWDEEADTEGQTVKGDEDDQQHHSPSPSSYDDYNDYPSSEYV
jgi:hypothetical protein